MTRYRRAQGMGALRISVGVTAICISSIAVAQSAPPAAVASDQADPQSGQQVEDIVVTAQRRSESSQSVPIAVSAFSSGRLASSGITETSGLQALTPGLTFDRTVNSGLPRLRGIGSSNAAPGDESPIAIYVDDVYRPSTSGNLVGLNNIERIEVLKGPQGTLFGRNASGGVVHIITRTPSTTPSVDFNVGYARFDTVTTSFYGTTGLASNLATDLAIGYQNQGDGWGRNLVTGGKANYTNDFSIRNKWFLNLPRTDVTFSVDYNKHLTDVGSATRAYPGARLVDGQGASQGFYDVRQNYVSSGSAKQVGTSLKIDHDLDWAQIVSVTGWRKTNNTIRYDQDSTPLNIIDFFGKSYDKAFSQELRLQSASQSSISWIVGGFFFHDSAGYAPLNVTGAGVAPAAALNRFNRATTDSYSGFGQASANILTDTKLTLGVRYTEDRRQVHNQSITDLLSGATVTGPIVTASVRYPKLTWRGSLDHKFGRDILAYASVSRGFKSGVFDLVSGSATPIRPEVVDAYEVGLKTQLLEKRVQFNVSAYLNNISDLQTNAFKDGLGQVLLNAGKARTKGFEMELEAVATEHLRLRANMSYLDAKFLKYPGAPFYSPVPAPRGGNATIPPLNPDGTPSAASDAAGNYIPRSPKYTFSVGGDYTIDTSIGKFVVDSSLFYNNGYFWEAQNRLTQPSYTLVDASITWKSLGDALSVKVWGKNLLGEKYYSSLSASALGDYTSPAEPLTFGVTLGAHF